MAEPGRGGLEDNWLRGRRARKHLALRRRHGRTDVSLRGDAANTDHERFAVWERVIAATLSGFYALAGELYQRASYLGPVDIGIAVTGITGVTSMSVSSIMYPT